MEEFLDDYTGYTPSILEDFDKFRNKFVNGASASFDSFLALWKELKFDCLFMGIEDQKYGYFYSKDLFRAAIGYTDPSNMPLVRILGLYLCYGIYKSYPFHASIKAQIRLIPDEWLALGTFVKEIHDKLLACTAPEEKLWHVVHVFNLLRKEKIFCLALTKMELFPATHKLLNVDDKDGREVVKRPTAVTKIFNAMVLQELEASQQGYEEAKEEAILANPSLQLLPEGNIVEKLKGILDGRREKKTSGNEDFSNDNDTDVELSTMPLRAGPNRNFGRKCPKAPNKRKWRMEQHANSPEPKRARLDVPSDNEVTNDDDPDENDNEDDLDSIMDLLS